MLFSNTYGGTQVVYPGREINKRAPRLSVAAPDYLRDTLLGLT
jgi:hypothetical protein